MSLLNCFRAQYDVINDKWTLPGVAGLKLSFSHFDGYSPRLDGSVRTTVVESSDAEKGGNIIVSIIVRTSSPSYKDNIRIHQQDNNISISTGGLSLPSYATAPRLVIEVAISLPRNIGNLEIKTLSLPIFIHAVEEANDVVIRTQSSPISVGRVEARSLTVSSHSGSIAFEPFSKQHIDKFTTITNSSGSTKLGSSIFSPSVSVVSSSGGLGLSITTTAVDLMVKNSSGSVRGEVDFVYEEDAVSVSSYENSSGSLQIRLSGWTGFLTAETSSGSKNVGGRGLERWNNGWRNGKGASTAAFKTQSGSLKVEVM